MAQPNTVTPTRGGEPFSFGLEADLLASSTDDGLLAFANDTGRYFVRAGSAWSPVMEGVADLEVVAAGPHTITATEAGRAYSNEGAAAAVVHTLPTATAGLTFSFTVQDADGITVTAAAGDTIRLAASVSGAGGTAASTTVGDSLTLLALNATEWVATSVINAAGWTIT